MIKIRLALNGWQRIGLIISVLWAMGGWIWSMNNDRNFAETLIH